MGKKTRSKTGCHTCKTRKVKCDEEKIRVEDEREPQCRRCMTARLRCEWRNGPALGKVPKRLAANNLRLESHGQTRPLANVKEIQSLVPVSRLPVLCDSECIQAANSLSLSSFDRSCLCYLRDSVLVVLLGKHWPWSTISYTYKRVAVKEPMVMSMILATTASEIHRSRLFEHTGGLPFCDSSNAYGSMHYGQALSGLRNALEHDVKSPEKLEAIFITLWLMIDYENRFGSGPSGMDIHMQGITGLLFNYALPSLKYTEQLSVASSSEDREAINWLVQVSSVGSGHAQVSCGIFDEQLRSTSVPLFLLWILYYCTPGALFCSSDVAKVDAHLFRAFLRSDSGSGPLTLPELYKISRQSPARFWGAEYPTTARLDDLENLPALNLYHTSHVIQFKITELFRQNSSIGATCWDDSPYKDLIDELVSASVEYDTVLSSARSAPPCEIIGNGRRMMETIYWASITYYSTIVYFYLCFGGLMPEGYAQYRWLPLTGAVSEVLELSLKLHRSKPWLMIRIAWPLFLAGIATRDQIYQDWVSIRLRELGRYGQNFTRVSQRFDEIIQGGEPFAVRLVDNLTDFRQGETI